MGNIIQFAAFGELKQEVEMLRIELSMRILEYDTIERIECNNIEMQYILEFSSRIYKVQELQIKYQRLKRELELIQTKINRQEPINMKAINALLDEEMIEYKEKLNEFVGKMNEAVERKDNLITFNDEQIAEQKKLYRKIIRALHPDLHPDATPEQMKLLSTAIYYYETGNIEGLNTIAKMVDDSLDIDENSLDAMSLLTKEKKQLLAMLQRVQEKIEQIKSIPPYNLKVYLEDEDRKLQKKQELDSLKEQYLSAISVYQSQLTILREKHKL